LIILKKFKSDPEYQTKFKDIDLDDPENIRIRILSARTPSNVLHDNQQIRDVFKSLLSYVQEVAIQKLPPGEKEEKKENTFVLFFQQFVPSAYEVSERFEFYTEDDEELDSLRNRLSTKTGCKNIAISEAMRIDSFSLLKLNHLQWFKQVPLKDSNENTNINKFVPKVRLLHPRDGLLVLFKDDTETLKELSPEEKKYIKDKENMRDTRKSYYKLSRERSLKIKQQDVDIDVEFTNEEDLEYQENENN